MHSRKKLWSQKKLKSENLYLLKIKQTSMVWRQSSLPDSIHYDVNQELIRNSFPCPKSLLYCCSVLCSQRPLQNRSQYIMDHIKELTAAKYREENWVHTESGFAIAFTFSRSPDVLCGWGPAVRHTEESMGEHFHSKWYVSFIENHIRKKKQNERMH